MKKLLIIAIILSSFISCSKNDKPSLNGIGKLKFGMSISEIEELKNEDTTQNEANFLREFEFKNYWITKDIELQNVILTFTMGKLSNISADYNDKLYKQIIEKYHSQEYKNEFGQEIAMQKIKSRIHFCIDCAIVE